jgi:hypothetical protein
VKAVTIGLSVSEIAYRATAGEAVGKANDEIRVAIEVNKV